MINQKEYQFLVVVSLLAAVLAAAALIFAGTLFLRQNGTSETATSQPAAGSASQAGCGVPNTSPTTPPAITGSETWKMGGYAVGKTAGNETDLLSVQMADVVTLPDGRYRMYYGWSGPSGTGIKSALSADAKSWTVESGIRIQGASDTSDRTRVVSGPSVVTLPDGRYRMYYQSSPQPAPCQPPAFHIRSAISANGLDFTDEGIRIDIAPYTSATGLSLAGHGRFFRTKDGATVGIFSGNLGSSASASDLIMATSADGLTFSGFKKLYTGWHDPVVLKTSAGYVLYATYLIEKQGQAVSSDGVTWPTEPATIVFQDASGRRVTEGSAGVGDFGGLVTAAGPILLYANWGQPSTDIVWFAKQ